MEDRDHSDVNSTSEKCDQNDGQSPVKRTEEVLLTEPNSRIENIPDGDDNTIVSESIEVDINDLIETHSRFLFGYAYRLASSVSDAEDLTQQTFLIAHQKLEQLRTPSAAKSWLCAILRSCWLKSIRRNRPTPASSFELELSDLVVEDDYEVEFDSQAIRHAIDELPDDYKLVLLMYYFEDLSYQEIAEKLQIKMGTVMSRLSRAKDRIRRRLNNKDDLLDQ